MLASATAASVVVHSVSAKSIQMMSWWTQARTTRPMALLGSSLPSVGMTALWTSEERQQVPARIVEEEAMGYQHLSRRRLNRHRSTQLYIKPLWSVHQLVTIWVLTDSHHRLLLLTTGFLLVLSTHRLEWENTSHSPDSCMTRCLQAKILQRFVQQALIPPFSPMR